LQQIFKLNDLGLIFNIKSSHCCCCCLRASIPLWWFS